MPSVPTLTPDAKARLAEAAARAFLDDPLTAWLIPDPAQRLKRQARYFRGVITFSDRYARLYTRPQFDAAAMWYQPSPRRFTTWQVLRSGMLWAPLSLGFTGMRRMTQLDSLSSDLWKRFVPGPHWYLMFLFTDPSVQGQGIGTSLLKHGFEQADAARLPCHLETMTERDVQFYTKRGFRIVWDGRLPADGPRMWTMLRDAQG